MKPQKYLDFVVDEVSTGAYNSQREPHVALFHQLCRFYGSEHVLQVKQLEFQFLAHYAVHLANNDGARFPSVRDAIRDASVYAVGELERMLDDISYQWADHTLKVVKE